MLMMATDQDGVMKVLTDIGFDSVDSNQSGGLDQTEFCNMFKKITFKMGVEVPSDDDLAVIFNDLDKN